MQAGWIQTEVACDGDNRHSWQSALISRSDLAAIHSMRRETRSRRYAPPSPNLQTGIPIRLALSARLSWIPVPGNTMTPIGIIVSMRSLRLNGADLACFDQSGLNATCGTLRFVAHLAAISSAPFGEPPCNRTMSLCLA